jgi:hypothetical protein
MTDTFVYGPRKGGRRWVSWLGWTALGLAAFGAGFAAFVTTH